MIYRAAACVIVIFWFVMSSLLIRLELNPESSGLTTVPVSHVMGLIFTGTQSSELNIMENDDRVGSLSIRPAVSPITGHCVFDFSGNLLVSLPMMNRQRALWDGHCEMGRAFDVQRLGLTISLHDPLCRVHLLFDPKGGTAQCEVREGTTPAYTFTIPLNEAGARAALQDAKIDPTILDGLKTTFATPAVTAKRSKLKVRNETIETYLISIRQGETSVADIHVSQLGQILTVHTSLGYTLSAEDIMP